MRLRSLEIYEIHWTIAVYRPISDICYGFFFAMRVGSIFSALTAFMRPTSVLARSNRECGYCKNALPREFSGRELFSYTCLTHPDQTKYDLRFDALELTVEPTPGMHQAR